MKLDYVKIQKIIEYLNRNNQIISTMESCTGGGLANAITNISGASEIFKFGAVTYSNKAKISLGGEKMEKIINSYTVYSKEVAEAMAETIAKITNSTYGIGITGQLGRLDPNNTSGQNKINQVDFSIYDSIKNIYHTVHLSLGDIEREENKIIVINQIINKLLEILIY